MNILVLFDKWYNYKVFNPENNKSQLNVYLEVFEILLLDRGRKPQLCRPDQVSANYIQ
jgi:hypothetical protein